MSGARPGHAVGTLPRAAPPARVARRGQQTELALAYLGLLGAIALAHWQGLTGARDALILALGVIVCLRHPAAALVGGFALTGAINTIQVFTPLPVTPFMNLILVGLWIAAALTYLGGRAERSPWLWPGLIAVVLYVVITALQALFTDPTSLGIESFKASAWYMSAFLLVAISPWSRETHVSIAKGVLLLAFALGAYAVLRWQIGSAPDEIAAARRAQPGLPRSVQERFFGSWLSANQLAGWVSATVPFCIAVGLALRGRWRWIAILGVALLLVAVLASDVRTGLIAATAGGVVALGLYLLSPAFPNRLATVLATGFCAILVGVAGFALTIGASDERTERFERILTPGQDPAYTDRLERWESALATISERPWGHGLATAGGVARQNPYGPAVIQQLDSSYLKVGVEQGYPGMVLYVLALLLLLLGMASRVPGLRDPVSAGLVSGGAGTLAALIVLFYAGLYSEGLVVAGAWILVGLGVAQITVRDRRRSPA